MWWQSLALVLVASALGACGNSDAPQTKNAAASKNSHSALMATGVPAAPAPTETTQKADKSSDVMQWLQMTSDKPIKPEGKANESKSAASTPAAPAPVQNPVAAAAPAPTPVPVAASPLPVPSKPTMMQVAASPANIVPNSTPAASASPAPAPANPPTSAVALANVPAAKPTPSPKAALEAIARPQPDFPIQARRNGITAGRVEAQITVGADGSVTDVKILKSEPRGVFDRAVTSAVSRWKYQPLPAPESEVAEFDFKADQ